jgi:hypothetical protein
VGGGGNGGTILSDRTSAFFEEMYACYNQVWQEVIKIPQTAYSDFIPTEVTLLHSNSFLIFLRYIELHKCLGELGHSNERPLLPLLDRHLLDKEKPIKLAVAAIVIY